MSKNAGLLFCRVSPLNPGNERYSQKILIPVVCRNEYISSKIMSSHQIISLEIFNVNDLCSFAMLLKQ